MTFKEMIQMSEAEDFRVEDHIAGIRKSFINSGNKSGYVTLYTKMAGKTLKEFSVIFMVANNKPVTDKEQEEIDKIKGETYSRVSYTIKKMKTGWKVDKNVYGDPKFSIVKAGDKLKTEDVINLLKNLPLKG